MSFKLLREHPGITTGFLLQSNSISFPSLGYPKIKLKNQVVDKPLPESRMNPSINQASDLKETTG